MIGDKAMYDVIVLEYLMACRNGLEILAKRLRARFPDAIIIFNMMWVPVLITGKDNLNQGTSFYDSWLKHKLQGVKLTSEHISNITSEMSMFHLNPPHMKGLIELHENINEEVNGHLLFLDDIRTLQWDNKDWVKDRLSLYTDIVHWNQKGHDFVAQGIKKLLLQLHPKPSNKLGTWGDGDSCNMWYNTGNVTIKYSPVEEIQLKEFAPSKYALEISSEGGELIVNNPLPHPRNLMITHMTTGPTYANYPKVEIKINDAHDKSFIIYPLATDHQFRVHIAKTASLDIIPPGESKVFIKPIKEEHNNPKILFPFRVVAVAVLGEVVPKDNFAAGPPQGDIP